MELFACTSSVLPLPSYRNSGTGTWRLPLRGGDVYFGGLAGVLEALSCPAPAAGVWAPGG